MNNFTFLTLEQCWGVHKGLDILDKRGRKAAGDPPREKAPRP